MSSPYSFTQGMKSSEIITPFLNISPIFDLINGEYVPGVDGRYYLCGGATPNDAVVGGSNTQKTGLLVLKMARILIRYTCSIGVFFDIEKTFSVARLADLIDREIGIPGYFMEHLLNKRFFYFNGNEYDGNDVSKFFIEKNALIKEELKKNKNLKVPTVFLSNDGVNPVLMLPPMIPHIDSASEINFAKNQELFREGDVDEGGAKKTRDLVLGNLRRILHIDADTLGGEVGMYQTWTAQVQDIINMTGRPQEKETTFLRPGKKLGGPKSLLKLPGLGVECIKGSVLKNGNEWMYPDPFGKDEFIDDDGKSNPDLMEYFYAPYRNKSGISGGHETFIGSQSLGIQEDLTMFHNLKKSNYYGYVDKNPQSQTLVLFPEMKLSRTTIRQKINETDTLCRALGITYQYGKIIKHMLKLDQKYRMSIEDFYDKVGKVLDWEFILNETVDYWFINPDLNKKTLSTFELMRIAVGEGDPKF